MGFAVGRDDDGMVDSLVDPSFEEQGHIVNHDGLRMFASDDVAQTGLFTCDAGMDDAFELPSFFLIAEDDASKGLSVERAVLIEDGFPKERDDLSPGRLARLGDFAGQFVGIDDDRAASLEHLGDGALAGSDAACEADKNHGRGA